MSLFKRLFLNEKFLLSYFGSCTFIAGNFITMLEYSDSKCLFNAFFAGITLTLPVGLLFAIAIPSTLIISPALLICKLSHKQ